MSDIVDRYDYELFLAEVGFTERRLLKIVQNKSDITDFVNKEGDFLELKESPISGLGLFSKNGFAGGELIAQASYENKRTPSGRFTNHSKTPNAAPEVLDGEIHHRAVRIIEIGEEILINYRDAVVVRNSCPVSGGAL